MFEIDIKEVLACGSSGAVSLADTFFFSGISTYIIIHVHYCSISQYTHVGSLKQQMHDHTITVFVSFTSTNTF